MNANSNKGAKMIKTETISKSNVTELIANIEKLNKKCRKLGCPEMVLTFDNDHTVKYDYHPVTGKHLVSPLYIEKIDAHLEYEIPVIEGWELVAKLDIYPGENDNAVLVSAVPDKQVPAQYKNRNYIACDHCGMNRNRYHSVLLQHTETGEYKEVGSTCVKDFMGHDPRGFLFLASIDFPSLCSFGGDSYGRKINAYGLKEVLAITKAVIEKHGWLSKGKAYEWGGEPTAERVWDNLEITADVMTHRKENLVEITTDHKIFAEKVIAYFEYVDTTDNDYLTNCQTIANMGYVPAKYMGFACSMVSSYERDMNKKAKAEADAKLPDSNWVGEIGQRIKDVRVKVIFTKEIDGMYGLSTLYIMKDALGNDYKTFYSGSSWSYEKDDEILITGTIKKHDEYNGKKSTMLNRVVAKDAPVDEHFTVEEFKL
jgi:hypothetical protein